MDACDNEFTYEQVELLNGLLCLEYRTDREAFHHLKNLYNEMNMRHNITYRFGYLKKMVQDYGK
ncbi:hypothetical protein AGMMS49975_03200 [Clostridia bacterium]|nr:hypothetical protein AGMMS49975_03200 [Clostridia bacterium]